MWHSMPCSNSHDGVWSHLDSMISEVYSNLFDSLFETMVFTVYYKLEFETRVSGCWLAQGNTKFSYLKPENT